MKVNFLYLGVALPVLIAAEQPCTFLPSSRPCFNEKMKHQSNVYMDFSLLYWQCGEKNLDYAIKNMEPQAQSKLKVHSPHFKWEPGFRFLVGYHLPYDHWNLDGSYTIYYQNHKSSVKQEFTPSESNYGIGIIPVWTSPGAFLENTFARWENASAKWKIHAHLFDLMMRHDLCCGYALSFQPAIGLKMAILQQRYDVAYFPGNILYLPNDDTETLESSHIAMNNRSLNIGPSIACASRWSLSSGWNLFSSLSCSLLASHFRVGRNETDLSLNPTLLSGLYHFSDQYWTYRPQAGFLVGVQWDDCFCQKNSTVHFGLSASYEAQYFFKQNMLLRHYDASTSDSANVAPAQGDLFFHGLTVNVLFDF